MWSGMEPQSGRGGGLEDEERSGSEGSAGEAPQLRDDEEERGVMLREASGDGERSAPRGACTPRSQP